MKKLKKPKFAGIDFNKKYICMECGCQREPIVAKRGLLIVEIFMWLCYIVPGVIYSLWRRVRKQLLCPNCRAPSIELTSSTRVMKMRRLINISPQALMAESVNFNPESSDKPVSEKQEPPSKADSGKEDLNKILKSSSRRGLKPKGQQGIIDFKPPDKSK